MKELMLTSLKPGAEFTEGSAFEKRTIKHRYQMVVGLESFVIMVALMLYH